jgi:hypothetical protein
MVFDKLSDLENSLDVFEERVFGPIGDILPAASEVLQKIIRDLGMAHGFVGKHGHVTALDPCENVGRHVLNVSKQDVVKRRKRVALLDVILDKRTEPRGMFVSRELLKIRTKFQHAPIVVGRCVQQPGARLRHLFLLVRVSLQS